MYLGYVILEIAIVVLMEVHVVLAGSVAYRLSVCGAPALGTIG